MINYESQRVGVFIDVQNMYYSAKHLYGQKVNFGNILKYGVGKRQLIRGLAYVVRAENPEEEAFFEALDKAGLEVRMKDIKVFSSGAKKGDWDIGLAMDTIRLAEKLDVVIIVSGDGDFTELVNYLKYHSGCQVEVMGFEETTATELVEAADSFTNLSEHKDIVLIGSRRRSSTPRKPQSRRQTRR